MNKSLQQLLALSAFILGLGAAGSATAADAKTALDRDKVCTACHDASWEKPVLAIYQTKHGNKADSRTPGCQTCHGASDAHLKNPGTAADVVFTKNTKSTPEARSEVCLGCHQKDAKRMHWMGSQHQRRDVTCASCHKVHIQADPVLAKASQPEVCYTCHKTERAQSHRISTHPLAAGKISCSDCHNPHGSIGPKLLVGNTVNETCWNCHAEKRGPFLFDHPSANDDCMNCHTPHGSTNAPLLKARAPWLCQQCHSGTTPHPGNVYSANMLPGGALANANVTATNINPITGVPVTKNNPAAQLSYRACADCHSQVHGSNNPAGAYLLR